MLARDDITKEASARYPWESSQWYMNKYNTIIQLTARDSLLYYPHSSSVKQKCRRIIPLLRQYFGKVSPPFVIPVARWQNASGETEKRKTSLRISPSAAFIGDHARTELLFAILRRPPQFSLQQKMCLYQRHMMPLRRMQG